MINGTKTRILIVDDNPLMRSVAVQGLMADAYEITEVSNGSECLQQLAEQAWDLVFLDVVLPDINGFEICKRIKSDPQHINTLVILISSTEITSQAAVYGLESGADGYIKRPIPVRELQLRVKALVRLHHAEKTLREYSNQLEEIVRERTRKLETAQEQLIRQAKLAVLGQISGSIGHELRNPLGTLQLVAYELRSRIALEDPDVKLLIETMESAIKKSDSIITNLLNFARTNKAKKHLVDANHIVNMALADVKMGSNIVLQKDFDAFLPNILLDANHLTLVFSNLILNAAQAMPDGGNLIVKTEIKVDEQPGDNETHIYVSFTDTGPGIAQEMMPRLFEPLFTMKDSGIGLGLSLVKILVEANGGSVTVSSTVGIGSTFTVRLPVQANPGEILEVPE